MRLNEQALSIILNELLCYSDGPLYDNSWPDEKKEEISFSHFALVELLDYVWDHPAITSTDAIELFIFKCQLGEIESTQPNQKKIFSIAVETALKVLNQIK